MGTIQNTLFIGKVLLHFPELASTNAYALNLVSKNKPSEGTVISTYKQLQGRGQIGSIWESEPDKNITLSIILYPTFIEARYQFALNQVISLAVFDFITKYTDKTVKVKWPNDIYIENNKVSGILIQNSLSSNYLRSSIIGIGVNVNQTEYSSKAPKATSLKIASKKDYDLDKLVASLCKCIEVRYLQLRAGALQKLNNDYLENLYQYQTKGMFQRADGDLFEGTITGITSIGKLLITHQNGEEAFGLKEVSFI